MEKNNNDKRIAVGPIDNKEKEFRCEIWGEVAMLFLATFISLGIRLEIKWIPIKIYMAIALVILCLILIEILIKENIVLLYIIRSIVNFSIIMLYTMPAIVSYLEQHQYLFFRYIGFAFLIYFIYRAIDRIRRINYAKLAMFLDKHNIIQKRKGTIRLWKMAYSGVLNEIIDPVTKYETINKMLAKIKYEYLTSVALVFISGGAAWGLILDRTVGFKIAAYVLLAPFYHVGCGLLDRGQFDYAVFRFLYKKQKELGRKLVIV